MVSIVIKRVQINEDKNVFSYYYSRQPAFFLHVEGSSSDIIVDQALNYISAIKNEPFFVVIWYGSPHNPWNALDQDKEGLPPDMDKKMKDYLGEIIEVDRSVGRLRNALKEMGLAQNTLLWFNSDNGGLPQGGREGVGGLRGFKGSVHEGGLRVPCVIEWPERIQAGQVSSYPASTMDIFPTIVSILNLPKNDMINPIDGESIASLFDQHASHRQKPIPFKYKNKGALIDNDYKLVAEDIEQGKYALYDLKEDPEESKDVLSIHQNKGNEMIDYYKKWLVSVKKSVEGQDYKGGLVAPDPESLFWWDAPAYIPYIEKWKDRPEYHHRLERAGKI